MQQDRHDNEMEACRAAIAALEGQRATLGEAVLEMATAPLRARLASLLRPAGLKRRQVTVLFADVVGSVRVGVHTGDGALGAGVEADNTAMGAAVNIAARMEQSAPPGALRISHDSWSHVRGLFEVDAQPPSRALAADSPKRLSSASSMATSVRCWPGGGSARKPSIWRSPRPAVLRLRAWRRLRRTDRRLAAYRLTPACAVVRRSARWLRRPGIDLVGAGQGDWEHRNRAARRIAGGPVQNRG